MRNVWLRQQELTRLADFLVAAASAGSEFVVVLIIVVARSRAFSCLLRCLVLRRVLGVLAGVTTSDSGGT